MPRGKKGTVTKSSFVRSLASDTPATDVVAAAKKQGIKGLTERYVYVIRSSDKARARSGRPPVGEGRKGGRRGAAGGSEAALRRAIAELGLSAARAIFREVEAAFSR
jgi:hypothetical protein